MGKTTIFNIQKLWSVPNITCPQYYKAPKKARLACSGFLIFCPSLPTRPLKTYVNGLLQVPGEQCLNLVAELVQGSLLRGCVFLGILVQSADSAIHLAVWAADWIA